MIEPLLDDEYTGFPLKRLLDYLLKQRSAGRHIAGYYCYYAPIELIWAIDAGTYSPVFNFEQADSRCRKSTAFHDMSAH
ncbi:MAG: hypothetical protein AB2L14_17670 [Candidatus Xenobiia bacterium LiM19]